MILRYLKENVTLLLIAALILILYVQSCFNPPVFQPVSETHIDTVWRDRLVYVQSKPTPTQTLPPADSVKHQPQYQPDTNCVVLKKQFQGLVDEHLTTRVYTDTLRADSSYVAITDTVQGNKLTGRSAAFSLKYPIITKETIKTEKKRNQLYYGLELSSPLDLPGLDVVGVGVQLKNKRDNVLHLSVGYNVSGGKPVVTLGYYQKLSLHKP